jgi:hypothetical protein
MFHIFMVIYVHCVPFAFHSISRNVHTSLYSLTLNIIGICGSPGRSCPQPPVFRAFEFYLQIRGFAFFDNDQPFARPHVHSTTQTLLELTPSHLQPMALCD